MRNWLGNIFKQGGARVFPWLWESLCQENENIKCFHGVFFCVFPQIGVMDVSWTDKPLPPTPDTNSNEHLCAENTRNESIPVPSEGISIVVTDKGSFTGKWQTVMCCDGNGVSLTSAYMLPVPVSARTFMLWRMAPRTFIGSDALQPQCSSSHCTCALECFWEVTMETGGISTVYRRIKRELCWMWNW